MKPRSGTTKIWALLLVLGGCAAEVGPDFAGNEQALLSANGTPRVPAGFAGPHVAITHSSHVNASGLRAQEAPLDSRLEGMCPEEPFSEQLRADVCSGVRIAPNLVLTAAHCLDAYGESVGVGSGYLSEPRSTPRGYYAALSDQGVGNCIWDGRDSSGIDAAIFRIPSFSGSHATTYCGAPTPYQGFTGTVSGHGEGLPLLTRSGLVGLLDTQATGASSAFKGDSGAGLFADQLSIRVEGERPQTLGNTLAGILLGSTAPSEWGRSYDLHLSNPTATTRNSTPSRRTNPRIT